MTVKTLSDKVVDAAKKVGEYYSDLKSVGKEVWDEYRKGPQPRVMGNHDVDIESPLYKILGFSAEPLHKVTKFPNMWVETWVIGGVYHRKDGPALIWHNKDDSVAHESWFIRGYAHRDTKEGPQTIGYYENGKPRVHIYCVNGLEHNEDGPAVISFKEDGTPIKEKYYLKGRQCRSKKHYLHALSTKKYNMTPMF